MACKTQNDLIEDEVRTIEVWIRPAWGPGRLQRGHNFGPHRDKGSIRTRKVEESSNKEKVPRKCRQEAGAIEEREKGGSHDKVRLV